MKKVLFVFALVGFAAFAAQAQSCCANKAAKSASNEKTEASCTSSAAAKAAALDENIEERVDAQTGKVSFVRRTVDASGEASYTPVEYCSESKRFINQAPEKEAKASCHGDAKTTSAAAKTDGAGCCSKEGAAKKTSSNASCCSKDKAAKTSTTSVKLTKSEN